MLGGLAHLPLLATITWDPFVRGIVILAIAIVLLPGSVYLVLSTDVGARLGFLLIAAAISGMLFIFAILWPALSSTADIGRANAWKPVAVITGDFTDQVTINGVKDFPVNHVAGARPPLQPLPKKAWYWPFQSCSDSGWHRIDPSKISDPESAADKVLAPSSASSSSSSSSSSGSGAASTPSSALTSPFSQTSDYVYVDGFEKGTNSGCLFSINRHKVYVPYARSPHYVILRVQPALPTPTTTNGPVPTPKPDKSKPYTYVIMKRDLGSVRQPQFILALCAGLIFLVTCYSLHRRDKESWAREERERGEGGPGGGPGGPGGDGGGDVPSPGASREPVGAGT
jgi:hypothetical protein